MHAALLVTVLALADPAPPIRHAQTIVVTAERGEDERTRLPAAITTLDESEIRALPARTLADLVAAAPGVVTLAGDGSAGRPIVFARGFFGGGEVDYLKVLDDEAAVSDAESGLVDWLSVRADDLERVEVLRGPASAVWGDAAMGGVVRATRRRDTGGTRVDAAAGSDGRGAIAASHALVVNGGLLNVDVTAEAWDGWREHAAAEQFLAAAAYRGASADSPWSVRVDTGASERDEPGALPLSIAADDPQASLPAFGDDRSRRRFASAAASLMPRALPLHVTFVARRRNEDAVRTILLAPSLPDTKERRIEATSFSASAVGEWAVGAAHMLRAGIDAAADDVDSRYFGDDRLELDRRDAERLGTALFLTDYWTITDALEVLAGVRWDRVADEVSTGERAASQQAWSPRLGVTWRAAPAVTIYAQAARAFKAPTLDQRFDARPFPDFAGGTFTISNPALTPQRATNFEIGALGGERLRWEVAAYRMRVDDEIDFDVATFRYANIGSTRHDGVELALFAPAPARVRPRISYAWMRVEPVAGEHRGKQLKNIPEHVVRASAAVDLPWSVQLDATYTFLGGRYLDDANRVRIDDAHPLDLRVARPFGRWRAHLDLLNVTASRYFDYGYTLFDFAGNEVPLGYPAAGRRARAGVSVRF